MTLKNRNIAIDMMKGFAIIAVIVGHLDVCVDLAGNVPYKLLNRLIYSFHIPLFFLVAGYFHRGGNIWRDFKRLIIPYWFTVFAVCLFIVVHALLNNIDNSLKICKTLEAAFWGTGWTHEAPYFGNVPSIGAIWFLLALFWSKQVFSLLEKGMKYLVCIEKVKLMVMGVLCITVSLLFTYVDRRVIYIPMSFNQGVSAIVFYYIGYCFKTISLNKWFILTCFIIIFIDLPFGRVGIAHCYYQCYPLNILGASAITLCIYLFCKHIEGFNVPSQLMSWCGRNSLIILCVHNVLILTLYAYVITSPVMCLFFYLLYALLGSWLLSKIPLVKYIFQIN
jgi:fucose 4-O-acetylase-like acetyltransferase